MTSTASDESTALAILAIKDRQPALSDFVETPNLFPKLTCKTCNFPGHGVPVFAPGTRNDTV
jgi:hypothetical protein